MGALKLEELPNYTYEDYKNWEGKWELIYGVPCAMSPAPMIKHQRVSSKIARLLDEALEDCKECFALLPVDWRIAEDTIVQPDNLVVCFEPKGAYLTKAPSLIFEILSKSTAIKDQNTKFRLYEGEGVKYYAIVNPGEKIAKVYENKDGRYVKMGDFDKEMVEFNLGKCKINFDFSKIWG